MSTIAPGAGDQKSLTEREIALLGEVADLRATLDAFRTGGIDAVIVPGPDGDSLYTLASADRPYRVLVEEMGEGAATLSEHGTVLYANQRFADLLGRERADILGRDLPDLVQAHDTTVLGRLLATAPGTTTHEELTFVQLDGSTTPVLTSVTGLDLEGSVVRCLIVADLTRRVEAEELLRLTMENAAIGMGVESPQGRFVLVNPALCQMLGRDAEMLTAMTWQEVTHPDDLAAGEDLIDDLKAGNIPSFVVRKRYLRPQGSVVWGDLSMSCVRNEDGSLRNLIAQVVDVSEQVRATQRLAESEEQYRLLADNVSDIAMRLSTDRRFEWVSGSVSVALGWRAHDLVDHVIDEFVHPEDLSQLLAQLRRAGQERMSTEFRFRRSDGTYRWVACRAGPKVNGGDVPVAVVGGLIDIGDRKASETKELQRLAELERFQRLTIGRELKMIELKKEIEYLRKSASADGGDPGHPET